MPIVGEGASGGSKTQMVMSPRALRFLTSTTTVVGSRIQPGFTRRYGRTWHYCYTGGEYSCNERVKFPQLTLRCKVATDVWTFSCPFSRFGIIPIGGRSTAIKLSSGDVWVLASTPLNEETKSKLNELGPVKYIVGGDAVHHLFLSQSLRLVISPRVLVSYILHRSI